MHQRSVITNTRFVYKSQRSHLRGKLKYFQFRDNRHTHIPQRDENDRPVERWVDRGLGHNYRQIFEGCQALATSNLSKDVAARTLVISPQVDMMQAIPAERQREVIAELTDTTISAWFDAMDKTMPEYAYCVHAGEVADTRPDGTLKDRKDLEQAFLHTHVVLAPTVEGLDAERENYFVYKEQIQQLHAAGREAMDAIWTRELGPERVAELNEQLQVMTEEQQALDEARAQETAFKIDIPDIELAFEREGLDLALDSLEPELAVGEGLELDDWFDD